jgi:hypothetical protein
VCLVSRIQMTSATSVSAPNYSPKLKLEKTWLKVARADQHLDHLRQHISLIEADGSRMVLIVIHHYRAIEHELNIRHGASLMSQLHGSARQPQGLPSR